MKAMSSTRREELKEIPGGNTGQKIKTMESKLGLSSAGDDGAKPNKKGKFVCLALY